MAVRLLENLSKRELEDTSSKRLLEVPAAILAVYPDPAGATTLIKNYDPYSAIVQLRGTQN